MTIIDAIEQEIKFMSDSEDRSKQYRKGYIRALEVVSDFITVAEDTKRSKSPTYEAAERLLKMAQADQQYVATTEQNDIQNCKGISQAETGSGHALDKFDGEILSLQEKHTLRLALRVLRGSDAECSDFLNYWLADYGTRIEPSNPAPALLPEEFFDCWVVDAPVFIQ